MEERIASAMLGAGSIILGNRYFILKVPLDGG
jgi:hypothetical protein